MWYSYVACFAAVFVEDKITMPTGWKYEYCIVRPFVLNCESKTNVNLNTDLCF